MTTTCSSVAFVKNEFRFFVNEASAKNEIYTMMIQSVIEYEIVSCLMAYMSTLITRSGGGELQSLEID
jgi:hypothetical protein